MPDGNVQGGRRRGPWRDAGTAFARLEERILLAAQPVAEVQDQSIQLGSQATIEVSFDNQPDSAPGSDVGYAPYIDLVLPRNGADGAGPGNVPDNDGVSFVSATYLGVAVDATVLEFDAAGQAIHPFARDAAGDPVVVQAGDFGAAPGDELVVLRLPFGSFVPDQPAITVGVTVALSPLADIDQPLAYGALGGFAFGLDSLNNPTVDPPIRGAIDSATITPTLFTVTKAFSGPEGETATGPNFPRTYTIAFDLAAGQTVTNAVLTDVLPDGIVVTGPPVLGGAPGTAVYDPATHTVTATLAGAVTGVAGAEATLTIPFHVGETLAPGQPGTPVLGPADGAFRSIENNVSAEADWTPLDPRDPPQTIVFDPPGPENVFTAKSIAVQKSQALVTDVDAPGLGPGDTVEYRIAGQVSDFFGFGGLVVTDLLSDGQSVLPGTARLEVTEAGGTLGSGVFLPANIGVSRDPATGQTTLAFDVSAQLLANGAPDGVLEGSAALGPATFRIVFQAQVDRFFLAGGQPVGQGDTISNAVAGGGDVIGPGGVVTGSNGDSSTSSDAIATGAAVKEVYALNGTLIAPGTPVSIGSGDEVTFRLTYTLPQSLAATLDLRDFLPLPVFDVAGLVLTLLDVVSPDAPAVNTAKWGPLAGGFDALLTTAPTVTNDIAANSITFGFADLVPAVATPTVADVLFTLRVTDRPFGDGLLLTNQLQATETSASGAITSATAIRQVTLNEPTLDITKGIVAFEGSPGVLTPTPPGPVAFSTPGSSGVRFSGVIDSTNLAVLPIDSDLLDMDAGDLVTFAVVVENTGRARNGAFDIVLRDTVPQGFDFAPAGLNLQVTDGAGNPLAYTLSLFPDGGTLELIDPGPAAGALGAFSPTGGANIAVITYDLILTEAVEPRSQLSNIVEIENYAAFEGGLDRVPNSPGPVQDTATVTIAEPAFDKQLTATSLTETAGGDLSIGETVTFELVATLREGRITDLVIEDLLPLAPGQLDFVSAQLVSIGANLFELDAFGQPAAPLGAPAIAQSGNRVTFTFADDIVNLPDNLADSADRIVVRVTALAADVPGNRGGTMLENEGRLGFTAAGATVTITDIAQAAIVEPVSDVLKLADRSTVQGGDIVTYTVVYGLQSGAGAGPAFDVSGSDPLLPGQLTLVAGSLMLLGAPAGGAAVSEAGGVVSMTAPVLLPGETITISYQAVVEASVVTGTILPNTILVTADSHPGLPASGVQRAYLDSATASVRVPGPGIVKTVAAADTSLPETGSNRLNPALVDLAIGEEVTYRITVTLPEAVTVGLRVLDLLPGANAAGPLDQGLFEYLSAAVTRIGASLSGAGLAGATPVGADLSGDGVPDSVSIDFGTVGNTPDGILDAEDQIEIAVTARVRDAAVNRVGQQPLNIAEVDFGSSTRQAAVRVEIVEPDIAVAKGASATTGDAGDRVAFRIGLPVQGADAGPAYDVTLTDSVPVGFTLDPATLGFAVPVPGGSVSYDAASRLITATIPVYDFAGPLAQITYEAVVDQSVRPDQVLSNTATLTYASHPGSPPPEYQRDYGPKQDTAHFTVDRPELSKLIVATDIPSTTLRPDQALEDVVIGETIIYLVTLRLPEATTDLVITDLLPRSVGMPPIAGDLALVDAALVFVGANITGAALPPVGDPGSRTDSDGDGIIDRVAWDFGLVANLADNQRDSGDVIIVAVEARVIDVPANQPGDILTNVGQARYARADGSTALVTASAAVQIVGPELAIAKAASVPGGDAGDLVTYTVTVNHVAPPLAPASGADAYALVLSDLLDPRLALVAGTVTVTDPAAVVALGNAPGDTTVRITLDQYALLPAVPLVITYQARLTDAVRPGSILPNTADLAWQSAPAGFVEARPDQDSATADIAVTFPSALAKQVTATSLPETPEGGVPQVEPGETVTYTLTLTLGEGTQRVLLEDTLPVGLAFVAGEVVSIGANIAGALLGVGAAPVVAGGALTFDFGPDVVNAGDNLLDDRDRITVQVIARVRDIPGNAPGTVLTNDGRFTTDTGTLTATAPVEVVVPRPVITKDASVATGDAGDAVAFTVVVAQQPGAGGPLYDLTVRDLLPAGYVLVAGSAAASRGSVAEAGNEVTLVLAGAALLPVDDPATPGVDESRVTLTYLARLADQVQPGEVVTNSAAFTGTSAPAGTPEARPFAGSDDATVTVLMPVALDKQIIATSLPGTPGSSVAVGETITYALTATLSEGTQTLVIQDLLPAGLAVVSAHVAAVGAGLPGTLLGTLPGIAGQAVGFDFGTVVNVGNNIAGDGTVTVEILALVRDVAGNLAGATLVNAAQATITAPADPTRPGGTETATDDTTATVVAPALTLDKSVPPGFARPGEVLTYTLVLSHAAASSAPAYDITLADLLGDPFLALVAGSVTTTLGSVVTGNAPGDATLAIAIGELALGQSATITYQARVLATAPGGGTVQNTAVADYDSAGGPGGRPDSVTDGTATPLAPGFAKTIASTGNPDTGSDQFDPALPDLAVGEALTYRLDITLPQGVTDALVLQDLLPAGLTPLAARVVAIGAGLAVGVPAITLLGQSVSIDFGSVANGSAATIGPEDVITVEIDAVVADQPGLVAGSSLVNAAALAFTIDGRSGSLDATAPAELVEPALDIRKTVDQLTGDAGDVFTYTVVIAQAPGSSAAAYDIALADVLDPRLLPVSATASAGSAAIAGNTVTLDLPRLLLGDAPVTLTYTVRMTDAVEPGQVIGNTAALAWDSNPGPGGRPGAGSASAQDLTVVLPLDLDKAIVATSLAGTGAGAILPGVTDLAIGEIVTYELVVRLGEGTQRLVIADTIPDGLLPLALALPDGTGVVSTGAGITAGPGGTLAPAAVIAGQGVSFDFGTLVNAGDNLSDAGDLVTVRISARVLDVAQNVAGRLATNAATATASAPTDPGAPGGTLTDAASATAAIVEPALALDKAVDRGGGDAGDVFTYTLTLANRAAATGPAYGLVLEDTLSPFLLPVAGSLSASLGTATLLGSTIRVTIDELAPDAGPVIVTYRAAFSDAIEPGQVVPNTATLAYASAPSQGRPYAESDGAEVRGAFTLGLDKAVVATSLPETGSGFFDPALADVVAGEQVTWRLTATLAEGTQRLVITDRLPGGMVAEAARLVSIAPGIVAAAPVITLDAGGVAFDFGTVVNRGDNAGPDTVVVEVVGRLGPLPPAGTVLANTAAATIAAPTAPGDPGGTLTATAEARVEAVAAVLDLSKSVSKAVVGLGESVTYTLVLSHASGSSAPAYNLVITDPLSDPALSLVVGSVLAGAGSILSGNAAGDTGVAVTLPVLLPGETLTVQFLARAIGIPIPDGIAPNTADLVAASAPGPLPPGFDRPLAATASAAVLIVGGEVLPARPEAGLLPGLDPAIRRLAVQPFALPGLLTGSAQPGATVVLELFDATGAPLGLGSVTADVGGNWVARAPQPPVPAFDAAAFLAVRQAAGGTVDAGFDLPRLSSPAPPSIFGAPYTVAAAAIPSAGELGGLLFTPVRADFVGTNAPGGLFTGGAGALGGTAVQAGLSRDADGALPEGGIALNRYALDFLRAQVVAGALGR